MIGKKINQLATELAPVSTDLTIIGDPVSGVSKKITLAQLGAIFSGAVSFYNDYASFPASGDINVIYCAKDTKKLYLWSGSAYVEVFPSQSLLDTYQLRSEKGNANGYASLDSSGKVPISQLPSSIMEYKGTWNAATNTPTLANGTGDTGDVYLCNVAGTVNFGAGPLTFAVGDYVVYSGTIWQRSSGAVGTVTSVAVSRSGDALAITGSPITTSGTINIGFAGTTAQYLRGDGTLATFPSIISQAQNLVTEVYNKTGATLTKGTIVYINGGQGNLPTITKALATGDSTSAQTYGVVQTDITNNNNGYVVVAGRLSDLDTQAYTEGTQLYLSATTAGTWTSTKQYAPNHLVYVGIVVRAHPTQGIVEIKIQNGYEMDELHNVAAQSPSNNDGLFWEASTSLWKNKSIATVLGYTPANAATYVPYTGATANVDLGAFDLLSRSAYIEGTASSQSGLLIKQRGLYNFVTGAYTQIVTDTATELNIIHNQANTTRRRYSLSVAGLQDGDSFQYLMPRANGTIALTSNLSSYLPLAGGTMTGAIIGTTSTFTNAGSGIGVEITNSSTGDGLKINHSSGRAFNIASSGSGFGIIINNSTASTSIPFTIQKQGSNVITFSDNGAANFSGQLTLGSTITNGTNTYTLPSATGTLALTSAIPSNPVGGTGTTNYLPKFTGTSTIGNSIIFDDGSGIRIGTTTHALASNRRLTVVGASAIEAVATGTGGEPTIEMWQKHTAGDNVFAYFFTEAAATTRGYLQYDRSGNRLNLVGSGNGLLFTGAATFSSSVTATTNIKVTGTSTSVAPQFVMEQTGGNTYSAIGINRADGTGIAAGLGSALVLRSGDATDSPIQFATANNVRMTISTGGNVGIGTTSPSQKLTIGATNGYPIIDFYNSGTGFGDIGYNAGTTSFNLSSYSTTPLAFYTNGSERMRITSGGNVGIGTTPASWLTSTITPLQVRNSSFAGYSTSGVHITYVGSNWYYDTGGTDRYISNGNASIFTQANGDFNFVTSASGTGGNAISFSQVFKIRNDAAIFAPGVYNFTTGSGANVVVFSDGSMQRSTSSLKYKKNVENYTKGLAEVMQMRPVTYNSKNEKETQTFAGLIAEEVHALGLTEFVQYANDGTPDALSYQNMVALLIKGMQELKAELDTLKNK